MRQMAKDIATYIKMFVDDSSSGLNPYILQGKINNEFISGNQNKKINTVHMKIEDKNLDPTVYTEKKIFNRLLPIYLTRYGILSQNMPIPGIIPYNNTSKAVQDSISVNNFINNFMLDCNFKTMYEKIIKRADVYGIEWIKTGIDWTDGDTIATMPGVSIGDEKGTLTIKEGRPFVTSVPIHEVFVDSYYIESMDDVNELVHRRVFPCEYIQKRWGYKAEKESINDNRLSTYPRYTNFGLTNGGAIEYAYVYEYYKKPDALYPKGRYVITCNDKVLWDDVLPYENGKDGKRKIPFDFIVLQSIPNKLIGLTVYGQLIPIQETYNAVMNRYLEYVNHIAIGQLYYWEGSLINKNNFTNKPGKLIGLKRNARAPQPVQKDKLSQEFINYLQTLENDMLITAGLSQLTAFGQSKSNVRTDGVVDKLAESDENKLSNAIDNISATFISIFKKLIYLEKQREKVLEEKLKLAKIDNYMLQYKLEKVDAEQVTIVNREFLMKNDQIFDKKLQQAGNFGLYNPQSGLTYTSKVEFLNAMHASYLKDTLDPMERATHDLCKEEQEQLLNGNEIPEVEDWHRHEMHIQEHELFRISPEVRCLKSCDEKKWKLLQEGLNMHIKKHQELMQKNQQGDVIANAKEALLKYNPKKGQG
jgi:hypothetical protein